MSKLDVAVGAARWPLEIPESRLRVAQGTAAPLADPRRAVRDAMEHPWKLDFPLRRAFTPDDRITLVVDEQLARLGELVTGVLEYLASAGIGAESVTILTPPGHAASDWIDKLPDEYADVHTEVHQPNDRKQLSYLAATKTGHRIYLNRTLVDADQIIAISARRFDPLLGHSGAAGSLYPSLSDAETRRAMGDRLTMKPPVPHDGKVAHEVSEIAWLLGSPVFIQVVEAPGDNVAAVVAGLVDSGDEGVRLLEANWRFAVPEPVDVVLATVGREPTAVTFDALARAAGAASRVVKPDGAIVVLTDGEPFLEEGMESLRRTEDISAALKLNAEKKPNDRGSVFQWLSAAAHARLYLASGLRPEIVEEIFATPVLSPGEIQRLVDQGGTCLYLPDADKTLVVVGE